MITLIFSLWKFNLTLDLDWVWTKWYLPIRVAYNRMYSVGEVNMSLLWFIYIELRFPMKVNVTEAMQYLPTRRAR